MLRFKFYRWLKVMFGARSFILEKDVNGVKQTSYLLINGNKMDNLIENYISDGWVEEWPFNKEISNG